MIIRVTLFGEQAQLTENSVGAYLRTLQALGLVEKREPMLSPPHSRRGRYHVSDPYLRSYYRFIELHLGDIQRGKFKAAVRVIVDDLSSPLWEKQSTQRL
jgi:hypothetical protein